MAIPTYVSSKLEYDYRALCRIASSCGECVSLSPIAVGGGHRCFWCSDSSTDTGTCYNALDFEVYCNDTSKVKIYNSRECQDIGIGFVMVIGIAMSGVILVSISFCINFIIRFSPMFKAWHSKRRKYKAKKKRFLNKMANEMGNYNTPPSIGGFLSIEYARSRRNSQYGKAHFPYGQSAQIMSDMSFTDSDSLSSSSAIFLSRKQQLTGGKRPVVRSRNGRSHSTSLYYFSQSIQEPTLESSSRHTSNQRAAQYSSAANLLDLRVPPE